MKALTGIGAVAALAGLCSCSSVGACVASGGLVQECKQDWTPEECADWDSQQVNGSDWSFSSSTCDALGYTYVCPDGTHVHTASDC